MKQKKEVIAALAVYGPVSDWEKTSCEQKKALLKAGRACMEKG